MFLQEFILLQFFCFLPVKPIFTKKPMASPFPWRHSLWLPPPGSRVPPSSPWRNEAAVVCCWVSRVCRRRRAARRPWSASAGGPECCPGGRGNPQVPRPGWSAGARPCCAGRQWRPAAGRRCGAARGERQPRRRLSRRGRQTRPSSGRRSPRCPGNTW